ncbi:hypothetical protein SAR03_08000 [Staphylococcus arlettae]|uniref:Uncharacterized protein n=1 Tax=Staphylococcus arlettae TaxID=29378 RepID=A0ABQ0XSX9_9STAP|nr:hypothetical protein SAR03_08000 [Staphylococcus arlettae]
MINGWNIICVSVVLVFRIERLEIIMRKRTIIKVMITKCYLSSCVT